MVKFRIMIGGAVKADHCFKKRAFCRANLQIFQQSRVTQRQRDFCFIDDFCQFIWAQHRHGIDHDRTCFGSCQPAGNHCRIIGRADQYAIARLHTIIFNQHMGNAVAPVGEFLIGAPPSVADQSCVVAESFFHHGIGKFIAGIEPFGIGDVAG